MDISLASNPFLKPMIRPATALFDPATQRDQLKQVRAAETPSDARADDKVIAQIGSMDGPFISGAEQTLKPYDTLMLPYRGAETRVSVLV